MAQQTNTTSSSFRTQPPPPNMATSQSNPPRKSTTKFSYLMTPEETTAHSFSPETAEETHSKLPPIHGLQSPPSSPATHNLPNIASATGYQVPPSPQYAYQNNYVTGYGSTSPPSYPAPAFGDAALFAPESERAHPHSPLFGQEQQQRQPTASPRVSIDRPAPPPAQASDGFSLNYPCHLDIRTPSQAESYWRGCCESLDKMRHLPAPLNTVSATRDPLSVSQLQSIERSNTAARQQQPQQRTTVSRSHRVTKSTTAASLSGHATLAVPASERRQHGRRASRQQRVAHATASPAASTRPVLATPPPRQQTLALANASSTTRYNNSHSSRSPDLNGSTPGSGANNNSNKVTKHRRAPASKPRPAAENWFDIEDYCPPISTLDNSKATPKPLKARAVGTSGPLDLSKDPEAHLLHPDELQVASVLRLQCAKYLLNKRKIFKAKFELLKDQQEKQMKQQQGNQQGNGGGAGGPGARAGTPGAHHGAGGASAGNFNKTEAQKACTIDVNKASSLFQAFEEVGWLRREWFEDHLKRYFETKASAGAAEAA